MPATRPKKKPAKRRAKNPTDRSIFCIYKDADIFKQAK